MSLIHADLQGARDGVLELIVEQGETRLAAQCSFAEAQEARAGILVGAGSTLAAAAVAVAAGALGGDSPNPVLFAAATAATVGFTASAVMALWSLRSGNFHSCGWYPSDFVGDIASGTSDQRILQDRAVDLQIRLTENRDELARRGNWFNAASTALVATPLLALIAGALLSGT